MDTIDREFAMSSYAIELHKKMDSLESDKEWLMSKLKDILFGEDGVSGQDIKEFKERFPDEDF